MAILVGKQLRLNFSILNMLLDTKCNIAFSKPHFMSHGDSGFTDLDALLKEKNGIYLY